MVAVVVAPVAALVAANAAVISANHSHGVHPRIGAALCALGCLLVLGLIVYIHVDNWRQKRERARREARDRKFREWYYKGRF